MYGPVRQSHLNNSSVVGQTKIRKRIIIELLFSEYAMQSRKLCFP